MQSLRAQPGAPGALLLLDIDHFKRINDRYGHSSGDAVLVEVARRVQACLRRDDLVVRWGGEEFLAHVSGMGADQALGLGRRILERIASEPVEMTNGSLQVTASMGLCLDLLPSSPAELTWEERLRLADLALYAAKSRGRSRAVAVVDSSGSAEALRAPEIDFEAGERTGLLRTQSAVVPI
jgi:diguanylate cyclase (GGDEF)-like protein